MALLHNLFRAFHGRTISTTSRLLSFYLQSNNNLIGNNIVDRLVSSTQWQTTRTYISEMRKSAFEGNILRLIRQEIQYEFERSPLSQTVSEFNSFVVDERPGEQWIKLNRKFRENEVIKIEVTMFDGSSPIKKTGGIAIGDEVQLHITMIVDILKGAGSEVLEFVCSAWPDSIEIQKVYVRKSENLVGHTYMGPELKELDDELQDSLYEFLESRGVNDDLAVFLHNYMTKKDKTEFIGWMERVKSFIEKK